jgi:hypothetical protein
LQYFPLDSADFRLGREHCLKNKREIFALSQPSNTSINTENNSILASYIIGAKP